MIEFLSEMAQFALRAVIIVACLLVVIGFIASLVSKSKQAHDLKVKNINKKLKKQAESLQKTLLDKKAYKKLLKKDKQDKAKQKDRRNVFVINFNGDIKASATEHLREEISAILMVAKPEDQVVLKLESPGGMVHGYGLAASQLQRIKDKNIPLIVCVDKVAASGGYLMASIADKIIAAPFAIIGSIGVVASLPNFNKLLKKNDIDYLEITAGQFKRTLTPLGEITEPKLEKFKEQIEQVHVLFKNHVEEKRPTADISKVATGEYWYGSQAKDLKLVDEIGTSDDYLINLIDNYNVVDVSYVGHKSLKEKLSENLSMQLETMVSRLQDMNWRSRFF